MAAEADAERGGAPCVQSLPEGGEGSRSAPRLGKAEKNRRPFGLWKKMVLLLRKKERAKWGRGVIPGPPIPIPYASPPSRPSRSRSFRFSSMIWASSLSSSAVISLIVDGGEGGPSAPRALGSAPAFAAGFRFFFAGGAVFWETSFCGLAFAGAAGAEDCSRTVGRAAEPPSPPPTNGLAGGLGAYASVRPGAAAAAVAAAAHREQQRDDGDFVARGAGAAHDAA